MKIVESIDKKFPGVRVGAWSPRPASSLQDFKKIGGGFRGGASASHPHVKALLKRLIRCYLTLQNQP
jgi:hypothetical protein